MPRLSIPTALRPFTDRQSEVTVDGATVGEAITQLAATYPDLKSHIFDDSGTLRSFVNIFVGDTSIKDLSGLDTPVAADSSVLLIPAIAGGHPGARRR